MSPYVILLGQRDENLDMKKIFFSPFPYIAVHSGGSVFYFYMTESEEENY